MKTIAAFFLLLVLAAPAFAQQVEIRATPPAAERPDFVTPGPYYDVTEPRENQWYPPPGVRVPYDPAFIEGASQEYETATSRGRYGLAGWTSQNLPVSASGTGYREQAGWLSFGFTVTWGAAPRRATPPAARPAPSR
jgi:hypothetical protein